jgi:hypothetical protein
MPGMRVEVAWRTPPRARPAANLITVDQASLETSIDGWDWPGAAAVNDIERSDDVASDGDWSMKVTRSVTGPETMQVVLSDPAAQDTLLDFGGGHVLTGVPARPGVLYTAVGDTRAETDPRVVSIVVFFFGPAGLLASHQAPFSSNQTDEWITLRSSGIAPADTTHASIELVVLGVAVGESHYWDRLGILEDGANHWALPGAQLWWRVDESDEAAEAAALRHLHVIRGARMKVAEIEASEAELVVDNRTRALDPNNSDSPYAPYVALRRRIRAVAEVAGGDIDVFEGFIERLPTGWELGDGWVTIGAGDLLSLIAGDELTHSEFELSLLGQQPVGPGAGAPPAPDHWWRLDEDHGRVAYDQIAGKDGRYEFDLQSNDPLLPFEGGRGNEFFGNEPPGDTVWQPGKRGRVVTVPTFTAGPMPFALDAWVRLVRPPRPFDFGGNVWTDARVMFRQSTDGSLQQMHLSVRWSDDPLEHGRLYFEWFDPAQTATITVGPFETHATIVDGNTHHVRVVVDNTFPGGDLGVTLIVDGVIEGPGGFSAETWDSTFGSTLSLGLHGLVPVGVDNFAGAALCAHIAWWHTLTLHDVTNLYFQAGALFDAGLTPRAGELTGARIDRVLDIIGVDPADRDIHPGTEVCGPADWKGQNDLEYLRRVVATEQGALFVGPSGRATFRPRVANNPPPVIALAGAVDPLDPDLVPYSDLDVDHSLDRVVNIVEATAAGLEHPVRVDNAKSIEAFGPISTGGAIDTVAASAYQLRSIGARLISRNQAPRTVITGLQIAGRSDDVDVASILALEVADAAQIHAAPPGPGQQIDQRSLIERIEHTFDYQAEVLTTALGVVEHVILPTFAWDSPGRGWDESVWDPDT